MHTQIQCKYNHIKIEITVCISYFQAYHVHIRSTSHHQKAEARKKAKKALTGSTETPSSTASVPSGTAAPAVQPKAGGSDTVKKGEHFCYVCNFLFSNAEVHVELIQMFSVQHNFEL